MLIKDLIDPKMTQLKPLALIIRVNKTKCLQDTTEYNNGYGGENNGLIVNTDSLSQG